VLDRNSGGSIIWLWVGNKKNLLSVNQNFGIKYILHILFNQSGGSILIIVKIKGMCKVLCLKCHLSLILSLNHGENILKL